MITSLGGSKAFNLSAIFPPTGFFVTIDAFIDVELRSLSELQDVWGEARRLRVYRICSFHDFKGTPEQPLDRAELREKFLLLTRHCGAGAMGDLFDRLQNLEHETGLGWIAVSEP